MHADMTKEFKVKPQLIIFDNDGAVSYIEAGSTIIVNNAMALMGVLKKLLS